ncbi:hypothetical protein [Streptomyces sp. NPDC050264]|uniref:hypothetical protein n=1 Tax=Streptomyces sp. NPDC050264 TaxID=3155038 RepID=UPI00342E644E
MTTVFPLPHLSVEPGVLYYGTPAVLLSTENPGTVRPRAPLEDGPAPVGPPDVGGADLPTGARALHGQPHPRPFVQRVGDAVGVETFRAFPGSHPAMMPAGLIKPLPMAGSHWSPGATDLNKPAAQGIC